MLDIDDLTDPRTLGSETEHERDLTRVDIWCRTVGRWWAGRIDVPLLDAEREMKLLRQRYGGDCEVRQMPSGVRP